MKAAALLVLVGCAAEPPTTNPLPSDGFFTGYGRDYTSPEDCEAHNPDPNVQRCTYEIALCRDGAAGMRIGDLIFDQGTYSMDGSRATATGTGFAFELDVATGLGTGMAEGLIWEPDTAKRYQTLQYDVIDCTAPSL